LLGCGPICSTFLPEKSTYKPQLKNGWKSTEADPMGPWRGFWNLPGFTWRVKANVDFALNAVADVSGEKPADIG
jgi:hypothetical protein